MAPAPAFHAPRDLRDERRACLHAHQHSAFVHSRTSAGTRVHGRSRSLMNHACMVGGWCYGRSGAGRRCAHEPHSSARSRQVDAPIMRTRACVCVRARVCERARVLCGTLHVSGPSLAPRCLLWFGRAQAGVGAARHGRGRAGLRRSGGSRAEARPCHVCTEIGLAPLATSAPGLGPPLPHLHRDWRAGRVCPA